MQSLVERKRLGIGSRLMLARHKSQDQAASCLSSLRIKMAEKGKGNGLKSDKIR